MSGATQRPPDAATVLVRAADAGATYLTWRWLDAPGDPDYDVLTADRIAEVLGALDGALLRPDGTGVSAHAALTTGAFADREREHALARALTDAVLPHRLLAQLRARSADGRIAVRITPSPRLSRVPWELLCVTACQRLIEIADVTYDPPVAVHAGRAKLPAESWSEVATLPVVFVVDPVVPPAAGLRAVLTAQDQSVWRERLRRYTDQQRTSARDSTLAVRARVDRGTFSAALRAGRSRLLYFGHVSAAPDDPGSAALHLADTVQRWGAPSSGAATGDHRPLTALDLLLGTTLADSSQWARFGSDRAEDGPDLWPMPARVAIVACEGGADYRSMETFGLVIALLNAGAGLVTTTRWMLPTDSALRSAGATGQPTSGLALQVDDAHETPDPVRTLAQWQIERLQRWREHGDIGDTPLLWASLTHTLAPARR